MKRPRRPTKRKVAPKKVVKRKKPVDHKIVRGLRQALKYSQKATVVRRAKAAPEMTAEDAAIFDLPKPPPGLSYQWSSLASTERMIMKGWSRVPYSRHPELPRSLSFEGSILYRDNVLFQIGADFVEALTQSGHKRAQAQLQGVGVEALELMAGYSYRHRGEGREFPIVSPAFLMSRGHASPSTPGDAVVDLSVKFFMPERWRQAAAMLELSENEYARRRLTQEGVRLVMGADGNYFASETEKVY